MIDEETVKKIARLSRLELSENEIQEQLRQFQQVITMMNELQNINTDDVMPVNHMADAENIARADVVQESMSLDKILQNAPEEQNDMFLVPKIM